MDAEAIRGLREALLTELAQLKAARPHKLRPNRPDGSSVDEDGQALNEMHQSIASARNLAQSQRLARVEAALRRLEADPEGFGSCEECEGDVPLGRLRRMPWVTVCVPCQEALDAGPAGVHGPTRRKLRDYV